MAIANHQALMALYQAKALQNAQMNALYNQATGAHLYIGGTSATTATTTTSLGLNHQVYWTQSATSPVPVPTLLGAMRAPDAIFDDAGNGRYKLRTGDAYRIELPDGAMLSVGADGSFTLEDKDAKIKYRAPPTRDFNPFLNASDKIEDFIKFCGQHGVRQNEMLQLPLQLFIAWLVIESAKADQEPEPDIPLIPQLKKRLDSRCRCGRFMSRAKRDNLRFCRVECFEIAAYDGKHAA